MSKVSSRDVGELLAGSSFCVKPWVHCHVTTAGEVRACCMSRVRFGNLKQTPLAEIWTGEAIRRFRMAHLSGARVEGCERCYAPEDAGAFSMRQDANQQFARRASEWVSTTDDAGYSPHSRPIDYDIRFSNICNFRCRTCNHSLSSNWYTDHVALHGPPRHGKAIVRAFDAPEDFWAAFADFIDDIEKIYFAGGEPLLQDEHYQVIRALHDRQKFDVLIHYNTNLSTLGHRGVDVPKLWRDFRQLHVAASLDGSWQRGELLRAGQSWQTVLDNRERLRSECPQVKFRVACAVSALNAWHVPDFHRELIETGFIAADEFEINMVQEPLHLSAQILPGGMKQEIQARIAEHMSWLRARGEQDAANGFDVISRFMCAEDASVRIDAFRAYCRKLDELRAENTAQIFPELSALVS